MEKSAIYSDGQLKIVIIVPSYRVELVLGRISRAGILSSINDLYFSGGLVTDGYIRTTSAQDS